MLTIDYQIVGFLILTPIQHNSWQIKNAVSFPDAPKGTSEALIYTSLVDLHQEQGREHNEHSPSHAPSQGSESVTNGYEDSSRVTVTFGISASDEMEPVKNLSGWKVTALSKLYNKVTRTAGLLKRGEFRVCPATSYDRYSLMQIFFRKSLTRNQIRCMFVIPETGLDWKGSKSCLNC